MARERERGRHLLWAWIGGVILVAGIIAIIISSILSSPSATPTTTETAPTTPPTSAPPSNELSDVVDPAVTGRGWVPEPITTDADAYIRSALEAAATFDTQLSDRDAWFAYLDTWFTPDTRYASAAEQKDAMASSQLEMRQAVVLPEEDWGSLAGEKGRVRATVKGSIDYTRVPEDPTGLMKIGTADVTLTFTRSDNNGTENSYDEHARVSVQVLCGGKTVPTPDSDQQPGDCKIVRYFSEPMEP